MTTQKLSVSLPKQQYEFVETYQTEHHCRSRSAVIRVALRLLQQSQLEACYREASQEVDEAFDKTVADGLEENETW